MNPGSKLLSSVLMKSRREERQSILSNFHDEHIADGLDAVELLLRTATSFQRPALNDIVTRLLDLHAAQGLETIFFKSLADPEFPNRHLPWLSSILELELDDETQALFLRMPEAEAVLPLVFRRWEEGQWSVAFGEAVCESPSEQVYLWGRYLNDVYAEVDRKDGPYPLLELNNLGDTHVGEWLDSQLASGYYDADILSVCIEREDNRYFAPLWNAVWARPKQKELALRALSVTAPHEPTPVETLLDRISSQSMPRQERQRIAHKLARSFSRVVFLKAQEFCQSPIVELRIVGIEILEFFGSPWHNSRDACVECLLSMLNDTNPKVRARAVEAITSSERQRLAKLNPDSLLLGAKSSDIEAAWGSLVEELFYASDYEPIRHEIWGEKGTKASLNLAKAGYQPQMFHGSAPLQVRASGGRAKSPVSERSTVQNVPSSAAAAQSIQSQSFRVQSIAGLLVPIGLVLVAFVYGVVPRDVQGTPTIMSTPILKGGAAAMGSRQFFDDVNLESDKDARSKAELEGAMDIPHAAIMLKRSKCWYLYHRLRPIDSAQYIATAPVPFGDDDPTWELYDTWLLDFIDAEMSNGVFDRVGEFVMTIAMVNPPLANQLVPRVLDRANLLDVDSVAKSMVKGGAIELERPIVHPALSDLDAEVIDELRDALLTGWKTNEDRVLANYLEGL